MPRILVGNSVTTRKINSKYIIADLATERAYPSPERRQSAITTVSYTHLDVYKRQVRGTCCEEGNFYMFTRELSVSQILFHEVFDCTLWI